MEVTNVKIKIGPELTCPTCGAKEIHPTYPHMALIRGYKVGDANGHWWSQCLVCAGYYDADLQPAEPMVKDENGRNVPATYDPKKGWF